MNRYIFHFFSNLKKTRTRDTLPGCIKNVKCLSLSALVNISSYTNIILNCVQNINVLQKLIGL